MNDSFVALELSATASAQKKPRIISLITPTTSPDPVRDGTTTNTITTDSKKKVMFSPEPPVTLVFDKAESVFAISAAMNMRQHKQEASQSGGATNKRKREKDNPTESEEVIFFWIN